MSKPWYVNPVIPTAVELFEVAPDYQRNVKNISFQRIYSDGTLAPAQQVDLKINNYFPEILPDINAAIDYAQTELDSAVTELQAQIDAISAEKARLETLRVTVP